MRNLMTTTAIIAIAGAPLAAQTGAAPDALPQAVSGAGITVADVLDHTVYVRTDVQAETDWSDWTEVPEGWEASGEIEDLLLGKDGSVEAAVLAQGGILDIGDTEVQVDVAKFGIVRDADDEGEFFVVFTGKPSELKSAQPFDGPADNQTSAAAGGPAQQGQQAAEAGAGNASQTGKDAMSETGAAASADSGKPATTGQGTETASDEGSEYGGGAEMESGMATSGGAATETGTDTAASGDATSGDAMTTGTETDMAASGAAAGSLETGTGVEGASNVGVSSEQKAMGAQADASPQPEAEGAATIDGMTAAELKDVPVFTSNDERVGEISKVELGTNGSASHVIVAMGGFLGIGETTVQVPVDRISIDRAEGSGSLQAHVDMTAEEMKQLKQAGRS